ncbi:MAG: M50 family metallopeptidase [Ezakiella sp.]|nr:M50 family metallopeptidase [Ezakiella sp.]MDD7471967.1 M50 family metallopeptidase [Bacillota bacterium]MDY3923931.1 M50 family metallopeptidase [Ezakiella sp.]
MKIVLSLFILLLVVTIHEWGHFIAGKMCGVRVYEFAIGFGPKITSWFRNGTKYSVRIFPLGGFCSFEMGETKNSPKEEQAYKEFDGSKYIEFPKASFWKKLFITLNGIIMNFILAIIIFWGLFSFVGTQSMYVDTIMPGSVAEQIGIQKEDKILSINGREVNTIQEFTGDKDFLNPNGFTIAIERNGEIIELKVPSLEEEGKIGIQFALNKSVGSAFKESFKTLGDMLSEIFGILKRIFVKVDKNVMGIVGFVGFMNGQTDINFVMILTLIAGISVSVGAFNLLPIIPLDGGAALIHIIEAIIKRPLSEKFQNVLSYLGMAFMAYLFIMVTRNDILRLF